MVDCCLVLRYYFLIVSHLLYKCVFCPPELPLIFPQELLIFQREELCGDRLEELDAAANGSWTKRCETMGARCLPNYKLVIVGL